MHIKTLDELIKPDERTLRFTPLGLSTGPEILKPEYAAEFQQQVIAGCDLHSDVLEDTRKAFERVRMLFSYGIFYYEAFTVAEDLCWLLMEQAGRNIMMYQYQGVYSQVFAKNRGGVIFSVAPISAAARRPP